MLDLFTAVKTRFLATDLFTSFTAIYGGKAWPDAVRPYVCCFPISDVNGMRTNKGRYNLKSFDAEVVTGDEDSCLVLSELFRTRIIDPPLQFASSFAPNRIMVVKEATIQWFEEDEYYRGVVSFEVSVAHPGRTRTY